MQIEFTDSFFKSLRKFIFRQSRIYRFYFFFRYGIFNFFKNVFLFRKELYAWKWYDYVFTLDLFRAALEEMADNLNEKGIEVWQSRRLKIRFMLRAIAILENIIEDKYIDIAEKRLSLKLKDGLVFNDQELEITEDEKKIFAYARKLEKEEWEELWEIIKGDLREGTDIRSWWD